MSSQPISIRSAGSIPSDISEQEWQTRLDLAAAYRLGARLGWTDLLGTHFSARVPGTEDHYLVNPYGWFFEEITASSLVKIDLQGNILSRTEHKINLAADLIHGAIYAARPDVNAILHLHSVTGVAVSAQKAGLLPISQNAILLRDRLNYYDYTGARLDREECAHMAESLKDRHILILRNHGTLTVGSTVGEAVAFMARIEKACQIQIAALAAGVEIQEIAPIYIEQTAEFGAKLYSKNSWSPNAVYDWAAFKRKVDREDPDYAR